MSSGLRLVCVVTLLAAAVLAGTPAWAQGAHGAGAATPAAPDLTPQQRAQRRFPQPVLVADLAGRLVLEPSMHQTVLGRVDSVVRGDDGAVRIVIRYGGLLGVGSRLIAVPVEATALLGQYLEVVDLDAAQLDALPGWTGARGTAVPAAESIRIGLTRN